MARSFGSNRPIGRPIFERRQQWERSQNDSKTPVNYSLECRSRLGPSRVQQAPLSRYVFRQEAFEFKPDGMFTMFDAKTGALEMKGCYKINSDRIS